jgi:hypothetical protein
MAPWESYKHLCTSARIQKTWQEYQKNREKTTVFFLSSQRRLYESIKSSKVPCITHNTTRNQMHGKNYWTN